MSRLDIETLTKKQIREYEGTSLYILNTSDLGGREKRAEILMTFNNVGGGKDKTIAIKSTWIPIDLMTHVSLPLILANEDFWHHVNRRAITVIDPVAAEEFLETQDAQEEYDRVYEIGEDDKDRKNKDTGGSIDMEERLMQQNRGKLAQGNLRKEEGSAKVISIMKRENITEANRLGALRNIEHELTKNDFNYIIKAARSDNQDRIKEWATSTAIKHG